MEAHVHNSPLAWTVTLAIFIFVFGVSHLLAITAPDNRAARAWLALGF